MQGNLSRPQARIMHNATANTLQESPTKAEPNLRSNSLRTRHYKKLPTMPEADVSSSREASQGDASTGITAFECCLVCVCVCVCVLQHSSAVMWRLTKVGGGDAGCCDVLRALLHDGCDHRRDALHLG